MTLQNESWYYVVMASFIMKEVLNMNTLMNVEILTNQSVRDYIVTFVNSKSKNTAQSYMRNISNFFRSVKHKELNQLIDSDLNIDILVIMKYRNLLVESGQYKNNTINQMIKSIKSFYDFLKGTSKYSYLETGFFKNFDDLPDDTENIDIFSPEEAWILAELALAEQRDGLKKKALILTAAATGIRKDALRQLTLSNFKKSKFKENVYIISSNGRGTKNRVLDKSKMIEKEIHFELYNMIKEAHGNNDETAIIFDLSSTAIDDMMKRLVKKAGFDNRQNLSFHSLRKTGVMWVDEYTNGDAIAITAQGNWANPETAYRSYIDRKRKINLAGVGMFEKIDNDIYNELSRDELIQLLKSVGNGLGAQLRDKAKKIIENR